MGFDSTKFPAFTTPEKAAFKPRKDISCGTPDDYDAWNLDDFEICAGVDRHFE